MLTHMLTSRVKKIKTSYKFWTSKIQKNLKRRQKDAQCCQLCLCSATFCPLPLPFLPLSALSRILPSNHFSLSLSNTHTHTHTRRNSLLHTAVTFTPEGLTLFRSLSFLPADCWRWQCLYFISVLISCQIFTVPAGSLSSLYRWLPHP